MQNLLNDLIDVLKQDERFTTDGKLLKNKIIEAGLQLDPKLIKYLLSDENIKKVFFQDIEGIMVFDKIKFQKFISNKQFLPDSYTEFKNRIGLTADSEYLSDNKEVVLDWAYKDCILEGGQDKEDSKRQEVFWNETLAPNDIDRLLHPKVLTNFKKNSAEGEKVITELSSNDNYIFKGNNLLVLHTIKTKYKGKVKLIYIDPPYNTGSDSFKYNDKFNHSTWLTFMKNRLMVAKELLSDKGAIFVQCDYHEDAYLRVLMDEIFGRENLVQVISVKMSEASGPKMAHAKKMIPKLKDSLIIYRKKEFEIVKIPSVAKQKWDNEYSKFLVNFEEEDFDVISNIFQKETCEESDIEIVNTILSKVKLSTLAQEERENRNSVEWLHENSWRIVADKQNTSLDKLLSKMDSYPKQDIAVIRTARGKIAIYRTDKQFGDDSRVELVFAKNNLTYNPCDIWSDITTSGGFSEEGGVSLPGGKKPESLLKRIIELCTREGDLVLDYHLGSGTTAAVAMKLNRRFIGIEQMDYGVNDSINRIINVIKGELTGISKSVNWKGGGTFISCEIKKANQELIDEIININKEEEIAEIWAKMQQNAFISYKVTPQSITTTADSFESLSVEEKKRFLIEVLDKNMLYVNLSDIENNDFSVSDEEKRLTNLFYSMK